MKKLAFIFLFIFFFVSAVFAAEKSVKKMDNYIAVFDFEMENVDKKISRPLTDSIRRELVLSGKYEVIERGNMNKILGEQKFQMSGCVSGQCIVEAGQLLGVGKIIAGSVSIVGKTYYLSLSLINVTTGKIENVSEDKCKCEVDELIDSSKRLIKKLLGEQVDEAPEPRTASNSARTEEKTYSSQKPTTSTRFTLKDGVIYDSQLGLEWAPAPDRTMNHYEAEKYAQNLSLSGGGWRLPTRAELKSLYDTSKPGNADPVFGVGDKWVWTSELSVSSFAWVFGFLYGAEHYSSRGSSYGLRGLAVRSRR